VLPHGVALGTFVTAAVVLLLIPGSAVFYIIGLSDGMWAVLAGTLSELMNKKKIWLFSCCK
jgi:hypothetical protein